MERDSTVLVVDDDAAIVELMRDFLVAEGFRVRTARDAFAASILLERGPVDCVLLDVMMPGEDGFDLARRIRENNEVPILFLSARSGDVDKIRGLGLGGDDYIVKSASPGEVVARVKAVMRRQRQGGVRRRAAVLDFGRLVLDVGAHEVRVDGEPVPFTAREFALLRLLAEHPRQIFTREQLFRRFWGEVGDRHTLTVHVGRIREKIEPDPTRPGYIVTVWGVGYRFEGVSR